jgi:hypothetical protein
VACAVISLLPALAVHATEGDGKATPSQDRVSACSQEARGLKGEEHDRYVSRCLKGPGAEAKAVKEAHADGTVHSQQNRMKSCNEQAGRKELKGDERRAFMSACLKG